MNTKKNISKIGFLFLFLNIVLWTACDKTEESGAAPTIDRFRVTLKDSTITGAAAGNTIAILGANLGTTSKVFFNDYLADVNSSFVKGDVVLIQIPVDAPYRGTKNKIKVVTKYGEVEKEFTIIQPEPFIKKFFPAAGNPGDKVTVYGKDLDNIKEVKIGTGICTVLAGGNDTTFQLVVPIDGTVGQLSVETSGGIGLSKSSFGVSLIIYDDKMKAGWDYYDFDDAIIDVASTEQVKKGKSIKVSFPKTYGGFGVGTDKVLDATKFSALKISIYVQTTAAEAKIKIGIKGADGTTNKFSQIAVLKPGWNDLTLDLIKDLSSPLKISEIQVQEWGNTVIPIIYLEDIGML
jgi:IPT/TIG domain